MIHAAMMFQTLENQASFSKIKPAADINVMKDRMTLGLKWAVLPQYLRLHHQKHNQYCGKAGENQNH